MVGAASTNTAAQPPPSERTLPTWAAQTAIIVRKDFAIEVRSGEVFVTSVFFAVLVVVIASLAFYLGPGTRNQVAAGVIWLAVAFSGVLAVGRLWQREREDGALDALLVAPLSRSALFAGKAIGLWVFLTAVEGVVIPLSGLFFAVEIAEVAPGLATIAALTTPGVASVMTLFGAMTARTRARDLVLAIVLFPLLAPIVLTAVVATRELLGGVGLGGLTDYIKLLAVFDLTFVAGGLGLFGILLDD